MLVRDREMSIKWGWVWAKETYYTGNSWLTNSWVTQPLSILSQKLWLEVVKLNNIISLSIRLLQQITNSVSSSVLPFSTPCSQRNPNHLKAWIRSSHVMPLLKTANGFLLPLSQVKFFTMFYRSCLLGPAYPSILILISSFSF